MAWQQEYIHKYYAQRPGWTDGTKDFHDLCASVIKRGGDILEIGSGPPNATSEFLKPLGRLQGIDVDPDIVTNDALELAHVLKGDADEYPFADITFDACVSNYVVEHVADPEAHLREIFRVLKPGGVYVFRAPNFLHYVSVVSHLTPHWFHKLVANRLRNLPGEAHDPYPTQYKLNSRSQVRSTGERIGFEVEVLRMIEKEPMYGLSSRFLFMSFMAYERVVNSSDAFAGFRSNILAVLKKPDLETK